MPTLTAEQQAQGLARFLERNPDIKRRIDSLTEQEADILGLSLDDLRINCTHQELAKVAASEDVDGHEFFLSFVANSDEEYAAMVSANRAAIKALLLGE